jgi:3D (Asp-Asp-Asp) domain-containing protein
MITNAIVTAYCACKICCGQTSHGICADGHKPIAGVTVAASRNIPLGTHIHISGFTNDFVVQDRLAKRYDNRFDIYFKSHNDALKFGLQHHDVTIISPKRSGGVNKKTSK